MKAIRTKYHGPTNTRGSRITASDEDGNKCTVPYPHELSGEACHRLAADTLCAKMKWDSSSLIGGGLKSGYVFCFGPGVKSDGSGAPAIHQVEMSEEDIEKAEKVAKRLGFKQTAYTSSSSLWGLFCLPCRVSQKAGCIIKTVQFGLMFVADLEDMHMTDLA